MTEIGPKTQTTALIGDADASASSDPFAFLSLGAFENLLDAEMIAAVMGGVSLEGLNASFGEDTGAGDGEDKPLAPPRLCWHWLRYIYAPMQRRPQPTLKKRLKF